jgi:Fic family protein
VEARDEKGKLIKVVFNPTEPALTPIEMKALIQRTQDAFHENDIHPLLIIANFIFEFLAIHPFQDGNGRVSRILTNLLLLKNGYLFMPFVSHERLIEHKKIEYYIALGKTQQTWKTNHEDVSGRLMFFLQILKTQVQKAIDISQKEDIQPHLSKIQSKVRDFISSKSECTRQEIVKKT